MKNQTYTNAIAKLGNRQSRKIAHCTYMVRGHNGGDIEIRYHETAVVTMYPDGSFRLDSGGRLSLTTRARIVEALPGWVNIAGRLERNGEPGGPWLINGYEFYDGMIVDCWGMDVDYQSGPERAVRIAVNGRRWFQKSYGNTYNSAVVTINGEQDIEVPKGYGYEDHYLTRACEALADAGFLPGLEAYNHGGNEGLPSYCARYGIELRYSAQDVARERDL